MWSKSKKPFPPMMILVMVFEHNNKKQITAQGTSWLARQGKSVSTLAVARDPASVNQSGKQGRYRCPTPLSTLMHTHTGPWTHVCSQTCDGYACVYTLRWKQKKKITQRQRWTKSTKIKLSSSVRRKGVGRSPNRNLKTQVKKQRAKIRKW